MLLERARALVGLIRIPAGPLFLVFASTAFHSLPKLAPLSMTPTGYAIAVGLVTAALRPTILYYWLATKRTSMSTSPPLLGWWRTSGSTCARYVWISLWHVHW